MRLPLMYEPSMLPIWRIPPKTGRSTIGHRPHCKGAIPIVTLPVLLACIALASAPVSVLAQGTQAATAETAREQGEGPRIVKEPLGDPDEEATNAEPLEKLNRIVAVVNDEVILLSELDRQLDRVRREMRQSGNFLPPDSNLIRQVLDRMILTRLQLQLARSVDISVDDEQLNRAVMRIAEQNRMSLRDLRDRLRKEGLSFSEFRENLRQDILISEIRRREVDPQVQVSGRDIELYLSSVRNRKPENEIYRIRHLLIAISEDAAGEEVEKARMRLQDIIENIRGGASFSEMAASHSDGQQALQGGDLGWRKAVDLPALISDIVPSLEVGDISDIIRSPSGFHIVTLVDKRSDRLHIVEQTKARHILVVPDEITDDASARQQLTVLREQILSGADFADIARARSDDVSSSSKGGDLGWINPGETEPEFEQMMLSLEKDEISAPFQSRFGWHIVQVLDRREHDDTEAALRAEAQRNIRRRKFEEALDLWLRRLRDEAYVEYRLDR
ncbi:peptidylprolyl isomerase [Thioalkalivibrio sp. HK1]|uniref:peptidylprolyl isomerase n=1 Tax=Thioalkalivibrio sp. HK1 TaxID=1469245 RepID=UPI00046FB4C2|nr:peptidylprolyl isomerase [Thioalkalivibrio sp. HK1]